MAIAADIQETEYELLPLLSYWQETTYHSYEKKKKTREKKIVCKFYDKGPSKCRKLLSAMGSYFTFG